MIYQFLPCSVYYNNNVGKVITGITLYGADGAEVHKVVLDQAPIAWGPGPESVDVARGNVQWGDYDPYWGCRLAYLSGHGGAAFVDRLDLAFACPGRKAAGQSLREWCCE